MLASEAALSPRAELAARGRAVALLVATRIAATDGGADAMGEALLFDQLARVTGDAAWSVLADARLRLMRFVAADARPGLYGGVAGALFVAETLSDGGRRYGSFRAALAERLVEVTPSTGGVLTRDDEFDVISGHAGIALVLGALHDDLRAGAAGPAQRRVCERLRELVRAPERTPWRVTSRFSHDHECEAVNLGVAHGVCGIIAALAASDADGATGAALAASAEWLLAQGVPADGGGLRWPAALADGGSVPCREGWCYGTPGVAAAFAAAGARTGDERWTNVARDALLALAASEPASMGLDDHGLCHGTAGVALIADEVGIVSGCGELRAFAERLYRAVLDAFDGDARFGYRALTGMARGDDPGFLEGASGIALALLAIDTSVPRPWTRALGLAFAPRGGA